MRVVEGILHHPQGGAAPEVVELVDAAEGGIVLLGQIGNVEQRLAEADPDVAVAFLCVKALRPRVRHRLLERELRDVHELAGAVVFPAVIAADDMAFLDPAFRQFGGAMAAAVLERRGLALLVEKEDDVLPEQPERLRAVVQLVERERRVPEVSQDLLPGIEHGRPASGLDGSMKREMRVARRRPRDALNGLNAARRACKIGAASTTA